MTIQINLLRSVLTATTAVHFGGGETKYKIENFREKISIAQVLIETKNFEFAKRVTSVPNTFCQFSKYLFHSIR